jgi:putative acyl-CoA dehydrogenase
MECLGGNGFVEESMMPRLFRQSPLNSIWEGSGNVIALDVLRAIRTKPSLLDLLLRQLEPVRGFDAALDGAVEVLRKLAGDLGDGNARHFVERSALALQAAALVDAAPEQVARAFVATRFRVPAATFGASLADIPCEFLLQRATPSR